MESLARDLETIAPEQLNLVFAALRDRGYQVLGPTVRDGAIVYDRIATTGDLPAGWTDRQSGGTYRLQRRDDDALFGYAVGPHSWKQFLFPPSLRLWRAERTDDGGGFTVLDEPHEATRFAFVGVRSCELHAIAIQDRVFLSGRFPDPGYRERREGAFIVAVNCGHPSDACFCVSMQTGPGVSSAFDLALTEVLEQGRHFLTVEIGSDRGRELLAGIPRRAATPDERQAAGAVITRAAGQMGRTVDTTDIKQVLYRNAEHPRWQEVADRCLSCGNCTMVCPTCFCSTVEDTTDLTGKMAERTRRWDTCFSLEHSYLHGGSVRQAPASRYRQWLTHKFASWIDQFGTSGCVGCGRCIAWCPAAIDITEELRAIRATEPGAGPGALERVEGDRGGRR